jgi:predicted RNase H-like nuclease (RuvC/YqgF family)
MNISNIKNLSTDNLLYIIQILVNNYEQQLDNTHKYFDEKIDNYNDIIDNKLDKISILEEELEQVINELHNEIIKNIELEKKNNNYLT